MRILSSQNNDPKILEILNSASARNLPVGLTKNGAILGHAMIHELASRDLHQIDISPDFGTSSFAKTLRYQQVVLCLGH